ncbi:MAG: hypothetical protein R3Y50_01070 [Rikenellaceae bacterium]
MFKKKGLKTNQCGSRDVALLRLGLDCLSKFNFCFALLAHFALQNSISDVAGLRLYWGRKLIFRLKNRRIRKTPFANTPKLFFELDFSKPTQNHQEP